MDTKDSLTVESLRIDHYHSWVGKLKELISSLNVEYLIVPNPQKDDNRLFSFDNDKEPLPFLEMV